jgi:hypothetical protein
MEWIKTSEQLPQEGSFVLTFNSDEFFEPDDADIAYAVLLYDFCEFQEIQDGCVVERQVTHWMPLPAPPEKNR